MYVPSELFFMEEREKNLHTHIPIEEQPEAVIYYSLCGQRDI